MAFANPLYAGITSRFFDFLVENINGQFEERCKHVSLKGEYSDEIKYEDIEEEVVIKCTEDEQARRSNQEENMAWMYEPA